MKIQMKIESLQNPKIKLAVHLRDKKSRKKEQKTLIEGFREIRAALEKGHALQTLFFCPDCFTFSDSMDLIEKASAKNVFLIETTKEVFEKISYRDNPDGMIAIGDLIDSPIEKLKTSQPAFLVVVEAVEKPGNLGTILRTADGAGVDGLILCDPTTDLNNPNVIRASLGTIFHVPVYVTTTENAIQILREKGIRILATTPDTDQVYNDVDLTQPVAVVMGSEKDGLSAKFLEQADYRVKIPMRGQADSLNVSAATSILLYDVVRQRREKGIYES